MSRSLFATLIPSGAGPSRVQRQHRWLASKTECDVEDYSFGKTQTDGVDTRTNIGGAECFVV
jgi:hypothetical protein